MLDITSFKNIKNVFDAQIIKNPQFQKYDRGISNDKYKISYYFQEYILIRICENLSIDTFSGLKLMTSYICENPHMFHQISRLEFQIQELEKEIEDEEQKTSQIIQQLQNQQQQNIQINQMQPIIQNFNNYQQNPLFIQQKLLLESLSFKHTKLTSKCKEIIYDFNQDIFAFYLKERITLLKNIYIIIQNSVPNDKNQLNSVKNLRKSLLKEDQLVNKLIQGLDRNLRWDVVEFKNIENLNKKILINSIIEEQIVLLQIIFNISQQQDIQTNVDISLNNLIQFYDYLKSNEFSGYMIDYNLKDKEQLNIQQINQKQLNENQIIQIVKVKDLGLLTFLQMLRIDIFAEKQDFQQDQIIRAWYDKNENDCIQNLNKLKDSIQTSTVDPINAIASLAVSQVFQEIQKKCEIQNQNLQFNSNYLDKVYECPFIEQLNILIRDSPLFNNFKECLQDPLIMTSNFQKTIFSFINLIYEPVLLYKDMNNQKQIVQKITLDIFFKNPAILKDIWNQINKERVESQEQKKNKVIQNFKIIKMYEQFFLQPIQNLQVFTYILNIMSGSNSVKMAQNTFNYLQNTFIDPQNGQILKINDFNQNLGDNSLLRELLVSWIFLLSILQDYNENQQDLQQQTFDQLINIITIFAKMIRQKPLSYNYINEELDKIKQNNQIQDVYGSINLLKQNQQSDVDFELCLKMQFGQAEIQDQDLNILLINTLFQLVIFNEQDFIANELQHVMDAISTIFASQPQNQKFIFDYILIIETKYNIKLTTYFTEKSQDLKKNQHQLPFSLSYLKFISKVFKLDKPQLLLSHNDQVRIHKSILEQMLRVFYKNLADQFYKLQFTSLSDFCKLAKRILKFTNILLEKFDCGDISIAKIEIKQPCPYFDPLLNIIFEQIQDLNLNLITSVLELQEMRYLQTTICSSSNENFKNKFIITMINNIQKYKSSDIFGQSLQIKKEKTLINDMLSQSLKCLNQILRLSLQNEIYLNYINQEDQQKNRNKKDIRGVKLQYIQKINCIKSLKQQILQSYKNDIYEQKYNIISLLAFYSRSDTILKQNESQNYISDIYYQNNILALSCIKNICYIYQSIQIKPDIVYCLLKNNFYQLQDIQKVFLLPLISNFQVLNDLLKNLQNQKVLTHFEHQISEKSKFIIQMLEILTICSYSQKTLIGHLFSQNTYINKDQNETDYLIQEFSNFFNMNADGCVSYKIKDIQTNLGQKLIGFFSVLAQERIALNFLRSQFDLQIIHQSLQSQKLNLNNYQMLQKIVDNHVVPLWLNQYIDKKEEIVFIIDSSNYDVDNQTFYKIKQQNQYRIQFMRNYCRSVISLAEFLKLVQSLYLIDPISSIDLRSLIKNIYQGENFNNFLSYQFDFDMKEQMQDIFKKLNHTNQQFINGEIFEGENQDQSNIVNFLKNELWTNIEKDKIIDRDVLIQAQNNIHTSKPNQPNILQSSPIYLSNIDTYQQFHNIKFLNNKIFGPTIQGHLLQNPVKQKFEAYYEPHGGLGSQFLISTEDLEYILQTQAFYQNPQAINELISLSKSFNIAISCNYSLNILQEVKNQFLMTVGKSKLRESQKMNPRINYQNDKNGIQQSFLKNNQDIQNNFDVSDETLKLFTSLLPLVDEKYPENQNGEISVKDLQKNIEKIIKQSQFIIRNNFEILKEKSIERQVFINQKYNESLFQSIQTSLIMLNMCLQQNSVNSSIFQNLQEYLINDFLMDLPKIYSLLIAILQSSYVFVDEENRLMIEDQSENLQITQIEARFQSIFVNVISLAFQIVNLIQDEAQIYNNKGQTVIMLCFSKVSAIMNKIPQISIRAKYYGTQYYYLFQECLRALKNAFLLLNEKSINEIINCKKNQALRPIFQRLNDKSQQLEDNNSIQEGIEETIMIVQFLSSYAKSYDVVMNLIQENILGLLFQNQYIIQATKQPFYSEQNIIKLNSNLNLMHPNQSNLSLIRNPFNILWCHVLVLLRNMNEAFLDNENSMVDQYLSKIINAFLSNQIDQRFSNILCSISLIENFQISHGLLEETELVLSIILQLLMQAQYLQKFDGFLQSLKDCLIFGTSQLLINHPQYQHYQIKPISSSETFLDSKKILLDEVNNNFDKSEMHPSMTLLDLKADIHYSKINQIQSASILELLLQESNKGYHSQDHIFPQKWNYVYDKLNNTHFEEFNKQYICKELGNQLKKFSQFGQTDQIISIAHKQMINASLSIQDMANRWNGTIKDVQMIYGKLAEVFQEDDIICHEYRYLNYIFIPRFFKDNQQDYDKDFQIVNQTLNVGIEINQQMIRQFENLY